MPLVLMLILKRGSVVMIARIDHSLPKLITFFECKAQLRSLYLQVYVKVCCLLACTSIMTNESHRAKPHDVSVVLIKGYNLLENTVWSELLVFFA